MKPRKSTSFFNTLHMATPHPLRNSYMNEPYPKLRHGWKMASLVGDTCTKVMEESSISRNISHQMEDIGYVTTGRIALWHNKQEYTFLYNLLVPGTHGCFVEDCSHPMHMDTEDDHGFAGSSGNLKHNLCNEKAEDNCEEQLEEPQADDVLDSKGSFTLWNLIDDHRNPRWNLKYVSTDLGYFCIYP